MEFDSEKVELPNREGRTHHTDAVAQEARADLLRARSGRVEASPPRPPPLEPAPDPPLPPTGPARLRFRLPAGRARLPVSWRPERGCCGGAPLPAEPEPLSRGGDVTAGAAGYPGLASLPCRLESRGWRGRAARGAPSRRASWRPSGGCGRCRAAWAAARRRRCTGCAAAAPPARPPERSSNSCRQAPPGPRPRPPSTASGRRGRRWSSCRDTGTSVSAAARRARSPPASLVRVPLSPMQALPNPPHGDAVRTAELAVAVPSVAE